MKTKKSFGIVTLLIGIIFLILTLFLYKSRMVEDVFCVILMTFSLIICIYGIYQITRDAYN
ncbi:MAG: hypothetical protein PHX04_03455 [Bacilli bacterium]|nr:hypothetical protein [Bacilli bacterium]